MKFVIMLWCNVWVCDFDVDWVVDGEITCSRCVYMYTLCFHSKLMKYNVVVDELLMNSWLVVAVIVMRCCWWLMPWVIIIIELEVNLCCSWRFSWKMGQMVIFLNWCFDFKFYIVLSVFYIHKLINNLWEQIWMLGDQNLGFWLKNGVKTVTTGENSLETRYWRNLSGTLLLSTRISLSTKLHSDSIPCFAFLCLFHTFLFWIGLWCKHESFR